MADVFLKINLNINIRQSEFSWSFSRSSGKGGQNVNKVNSKATLKWDPYQSHGLTDEIKKRFLNKYNHKLNTDGCLIIQSDRYRDQPQNCEDCIDKLKSMLLSVALAPKIRKPTKPTR